MVNIAKLSYVDFKDLKNTVSMTDVLAMLQLQLRPDAGRLRGRCPIHGGANDREFVVTPAKQAFYCFGCRAGGDIIRLVAAVNRCTQQQAAMQIARHFDVGSESRRGHDPDRPPRADPPLHADAGSDASKLRPAALQPLDYLQTDFDGRDGLDVSSETLATFGAGYAPKGTVRGRLAIPVHNDDGLLVAYCGRRIRDDGSALLAFHTSFDPRSVLFNAHRIEPGGSLFLARDPLAVLRAHESGIVNVVALLTDDLAPAQLSRLVALVEARSIAAVEIF